MEVRSSADGVMCQIRKSHNDEFKNKNSTAGTTKFRLQFRKGIEMEFLEESAFILEIISAIQGEDFRSICN